MEHDQEQEVNIRGLGPDGFRDGEITTWNHSTRTFTVHFPEDYLTYQGLEILGENGEIMTMREGNIQRLLKNLRHVAETGEFPNV